MSATLQASGESQSSIWLRGLLAVAWADGDFDEDERQLIAEFAGENAVEDLQPLTLDELKASFGANTTLAENFLRTAVMVAVADGVYSEPEDQLLHQFCQVLNVGEEAIDSLRHTLECDFDTTEATEATEFEAAQTTTQAFPTVDSSDAVSDTAADRLNSGVAYGLTPPKAAGKAAIDVLAPVRNWLDHLEMHDPQVARFLCKMIPAQCPFERDIKLFGDKVVHIPPMCKLNPLYEQMVGLRFRALCYLADDCGEDISPYLEVSKEDSR